MYIALVATLPGEQGKGYAEAVMRHAIEQGQTGMGKRRIVLHPSDMGLPLYSIDGLLRWQQDSPVRSSLEPSSDRRGL